MWYLILRVVWSTAMVLENEEWTRAINIRWTEMKMRLVSVVKLWYSNGGFAVDKCEISTFALLEGQLFITN